MCLPPELREKITAREQYLAEASEDPDNPLTQYSKSPDTQSLKEWFNEWREGKVLDSKMVWAPDVYSKSGKSKVINAEFVRYLDLQRTLHLQAPWANRFLFKQTIKKYFPEVSADFEEMASNIATLLERARVRQLKQELRRSRG